jgi:hypothetical protein
VPAGEVLNCNTYDVGLHAAVELGADKLFFLHTEEVTSLGLSHWLPLSEAQNMLIKKLEVGGVRGLGAQMGNGLVWVGVGVSPAGLRARPAGAPGA